MTWDDEAGFDTSDPKHPGWADRMYDAADLIRKREREEAKAAVEVEPDEDVAA